MTIGKKIIAGYGAVLIVLVLVFSGAFYSLRQTQEKYNEIIDMYGGLIEGSYAIRFETRNQVSDYRGFLLYSDKRQEFQDLLQEDYRRIDGIIEQMKNAPLSEEGLGTVLRIAGIQKEFEKGQRKIIDMMLQGKAEEAVASSIDEVRPVTEAIFAATDKFRDLQFKRIDQRRDQAVSEIERYSLGMAIISLLGFFTGVVFSIYLSRSITQQLREAISLLASSSTEILATTTQVASGSAETATAVSETTSTVEEVRQTVELARQKAKQVSENAQKTVQITQSGRQAVEDLIAGMDRIQAQTALAAECIVKLSEQSQAIGEIILTVNDLTEQSNLLSVNAAIEAAKAGQQGKGFTVVAQEIKNLATQSKQATAQVRLILGDIQKATVAAVMATDLSSKAVKEGVQQSDKAGEAIRLLAESFAGSAHAAVQIASSSQQQMVGMEQVALAMENIKQASVQNMAGTQQAEAAAQNLHDLGLKLNLLV